MDRPELIRLLTDARWYDLTQALSIFTPPWPGEMPLQVHFFKRLTGSFHGGQGANGQLIEWSNNTGCHLVGPRAFHSGSRAIADVSADRALWVPAWWPISRTRSPTTVSTRPR